MKTTKDECIFIPNKFTLLTIILCAFSAFGQSDYYWVGGTGNWSNYSSHWATSSGGNIFHTTTPSSNDNVIFDSNSFYVSGGFLEIDLSGKTRIHTLPTLFT